MSEVGEWVMKFCFFNREVIELSSDKFLFSSDEVLN